jgi:hypothetical protein
VSDSAPRSTENAEVSQNETAIARAGLNPATRRVVLLGASNLTRGISTVIETAENIWGRPLEILGALGHGRSYGMESNVLGRRLPGIVQCGLWNALAQSDAKPTAALITDIGNDILYEVPVAQIISWVQTTIERLQTIDANICVTLPPLDSARGLTLKKFLFFRKLFFPRCRLELNEVVERAHQLNDGIESLGQSHGVRVVAQRGQWYGFDPIHIRLRQWRNAWFEILKHWSDDRSAYYSPARGSLMRWTYLRTREPEARSIFGRNMRKNQPSALFRSGTRVSFF